MEYHIETRGSVEELIEKVNELREQGWVLEGGVSVAVCHETWENQRKGYSESSTEWLFAQALSRTSEQARAAAARRD